MISDIVRKLNESEHLSDTERAELTNTLLAYSRTANMGMLNQGRFVRLEFISPNDTSTSTDPLDTGFTGAFQSGRGYTWPAGTFQLGTVKNGQISVGFNTSGDFLAANGAYTLNENGSREYGVEFLDIHQATIGAETRYFQRGFEDNNGVPSYKLEYYQQPTSPISIPNGDFSSGDMSDWTETQLGVTLAALGTLNPSAVIYSLVVDGSGNIYAAGQLLSTSSVWKWDGSSWTPLGTLNPSALLYAIAIDGSGNLYAGGDSLATSSVWKYSSGSWAAVGTLSTSFAVRTLAVDGSNNIYAGGGSFTTSSVWKYSSGSWAALGTLSTSAVIWKLVFDGSGDLYAGGASLSTSSVWKYSGGAWGAVGTLAPTKIAYDLVISGSNVYAGGTYSTTSQVWLWNGSSWAAVGALTAPTEIYALAINGSGTLFAAGLTSGATSVYYYTGSAWAEYGYPANIVNDLLFSGATLYAATQFGTPSSVWYYTINAWNASASAATIISDAYLSPTFESAARFAVTGGTTYTFQVDTSGTGTGGSVVVNVSVAFFAASSGGAAIETDVVSLRSGTTLSSGTSTASIQAPLTANYAAFYVTVSGTGTSFTASIDNFAAGETTELAYLKLSDDGVFAGDETGEIQLVPKILLGGSLTVWDDLRVEPIVRNVGAVKAPNFNTWVGSLGLYSFNNAIASSEKEVYFNVQMPHNWKEGSEIHPHVHWVPLTAGSAGDKVRWGLEYTKAKIGDAFSSSPATIYADTTSAGDITVADSHSLTPFAAISMTGDTLSTVLVCRLFRNSSNAADTYTGTAGLLYIDIHYEIDSMGSQEMYTK